MKKLLTLIPVVAILCACHTSSSNVNRIISITGTGTKAAIEENPLTGLYEFKVGRTQLAGTVIPVVWQTNSTGSISAITPNVVQRYEIIGRNGIFGNVGLTWTVATGELGCVSTLGAMTPPVNLGQATNGNVGTQGFSSTNSPAK